MAPDTCLPLSIHRLRPELLRSHDHTWRQRPTLLILTLFLNSVMSSFFALALSCKCSHSLDSIAGLQLDWAHVLLCAYLSHPPTLQNYLALAFWQQFYNFTSTIWASKSESQNSTKFFRINTVLVYWWHKLNDLMCPLQKLNFCTHQFRSLRNGSIQVSWDPQMISPQCCNSYSLELTPKNSSYSELLFNTTNYSTIIQDLELDVTYAARVVCKTPGGIVLTSDPRDIRNGM